MFSIESLHRPCSSQRFVISDNCSSAFFTKRQLLNFLIICHAIIISKKSLIRGDYVGIVYPFTRGFGRVSAIFHKMAVI